MIRKIKKWIMGYVVISISGLNKNRLISICKNNEINLYDIKHLDTEYIVGISQRNYKKLLNYNNKTKCNITVINKIGLPHFFYKYRKRKIFCICLILFAICIYIFSLFIWNISIEGNYSYTKEELIKDIKENYVHIASLKSDVDCNKLEKELRQRYDKLAWISCEIKGTNLIIDIKESISSEEIIEYEKPCNIVAYKDAIITEIITNNGSRIVNQGDEVSKNDILITGVVNIYNEYDEIFDTNYTNAKGTVKGIVEYSYKDEFELNYVEKKYINNSKNSFSIIIGNNKINLPSKKGNSKYYDLITEDKVLKLFDNFYLPLGLSKTTYKEYTLSSKTLTANEAKQKAKKRLNLYLENLKKKGVSIRENNVTITIEGNKCIAQGIIVCEEIIGVPQELEIINKGEEP